MSSGHHSRTTLLCTGCFLLAFFMSMRIFNDGAGGWKQIVTSDGRGYYAYLPAFLLDHDPTFAGVAKHETSLAGYWHYKQGYLVRSGSATVNKYFAGEALLLLPFFLAATLFSWISGTAVDGYSFFFQLFAGLGALFYLVMGFCFLLRILDHLHVRQGIATMAILAILFGTNLFYYSLWQPTMSHLYSFFLINGFLWISLESLRNWNAGRAFTMGILLGLILLTRPTNIIVIMLIPFLAGDRTTLRCFLSDLRAKPKAALVFSITFAALCAIQAAAWYVQTGRLLLWSYGHEGFHLASPAIYSVLFSFRKGLFIYTPLVLVSLTGLILLFLKNKMQFFTISGFLIVATWIIAGWWNWYYGDGFGLRAFVDYYGVFAILLALVMNMFHTRAGIAAMLAMLIPFVVLNLVQTWQYTHRVIQPNSMNLEKYRYVLMRTDSAAINCLGGVREIADYGTDLAHPVKLLFNDFETTPGNWSTFTQVKTGSAYSGKTAGYLDPEHQFSSGVAIRASGLGRLPASFFVAGEIMVRDSVAGASNRSLVVLSMDSIRPGENWWQGFLLNDTPQNTAGKWRRCTFSLMTPEIANPGGLLKIYIWNTGRKPVLVDDFAVRIYGKGR